MTQKVTLPADVARQLDYVRTEAGSNWRTMELISQSHNFAKHNAPSVIRYFLTGHKDDLMTALINGYEVEQTPEDKLRRRYASHSDIVTFYKDADLVLAEHKQERFSSGYISGARDVMEVYGIKIEGINA